MQLEEYFEFDDSDRIRLKGTRLPIEVLIDQFLEGASRVVVQHHEKWDGSGYPWGLAGTAIDRNARIFAVADAFDAMTSDRVYSAGKSYEEAAAEITRAAGTHFDPKVVEAFSSVPRQEWCQYSQR